MKTGSYRAAVLIALVLLMSGCVTSPVYTVKQNVQEGNCLADLPEMTSLIGLAVSGGGSRAALFAAGGFEALAALRVGPERRSLLDQVSVISSVSGGSLASAYYTLKKPSHAVPMLSPTETLSEEYQQFFTELKEAMSLDYEAPLLRRQIFRFRWLNPAWSAKSLSEVLSEDYLGDATFHQLRGRESSGDAPHLILNTTLYNNGRRLILSTLPAADSRYDFIRTQPSAEKDSATNTAANAVLREKWQTLLSLTPQDLQFDHCQIKIASAVAASMSFPPFIGPVTFHVEGQDTYWHAGDGGLSDNTGVESLFMLFLKKLQEGKASRALIIMLDSGFPFAVGGERLTHFPQGFDLFNYDYSRISAIMEERAITYRVLFAEVARREGLLPESANMLIVPVRHIDAQWDEDLSDLPESCRKENPPLSKPKEVVSRLAKIVTRLWLNSSCERDLVLVAARKVVAQKESAIRAFLEK